MVALSETIGDYKYDLSLFLSTAYINRRDKN